MPSPCECQDEHSCTYDQKELPCANGDWCLVKDANCATVKDTDSDTPWAYCNSTAPPLSDDDELEGIVVNGCDLKYGVVDFQLIKKGSCLAGQTSSSSALLDLEFHIGRRSGFYEVSVLGPLFLVVAIQTCDPPSCRPADPVFASCAVS